MAVSLWATGLYLLLLLLLQGCLCSAEQTGVGCMRWTIHGNEACCETCHPGNRLVRQCGSNPKDLCKPCEPDTFALQPQQLVCQVCTRCVGAHVLLEACTTTKDTKCGCKEGLTCGNSQCTFCVKKCGKGEEPTEKRSCRPCPEGKFNDQIHQTCKFKKTKCLEDQYIISKGDASSDIVCGNVTVGSTHNPNPPVDATEQTWPLVIAVVTSLALTCVCVFVIASAGVKILKKRKEKTKKDVATTKEPIIRRPTDEPMTLRAIECSFHEAQQEQGSSSESLNSKDSAEPLI
ncbi:hypothetical protein INR49_017078, partial [Caranx melampygus]